MNDVTKRRVGNFAMRIVDNYRFPRGAHSAAHNPVVAAGLANQIERHPCRAGTLEEFSIRFDNLWLRKRELCTAPTANAHTCEDVLADDPEPPGGPTVAWTQIRPENAGPRVFEKGWAYRVAGTIPVTARLN